jgi:Type III secretion protein YscO.
MAYPLQPLLSVRSFREDNAKAAVSAAEAAVLQAEEKLAERQAEFERYRQWLPEEKERRYDAIMGKEMTMPDLERFKAGLSVLDDGLFVREDAVQEAEKAVEERRNELRTAQRNLTAARKEKMKIEAHKDIWAQAAAKEAEHAADLELEDFSPKTALQPPGHQEDS